MRNSKIYILIFLFAASSVAAQNNFLSFYNRMNRTNTYEKLDAHQVARNMFLSTNRSIETIRDSLNPKSPLWVPLIESIGLNLALGAFNAYVTNSEFAKIGWDTICDNFKHGFGSDADSFLTNMFAHPFHGSIYFNTARSNGFDYWSSLGVAAFGSWQWEFFMENEHPAYNDWIETSLGGAMLGEITYRVTNFLIDETSRGLERVFREIGTGILNPGREFNRLIYGRAWRQNPHDIYEKKSGWGYLALGGNTVWNGTEIEGSTENLMLTLKYIYGKPFVKEKRKPFDFFTLDFGMNFGGEQPLIGYLYSYGLLHGKSLSFRKNQKMLIGLFQHFDYINSNIYQVGGISIGGGLIYKFPNISKGELVTSTHISVMVMGGADSEYAPYYEVEGLDSARTYNLGVGLSGKFEGVLRLDIGSLYISYNLYWIKTIDGAPGSESVGIIKPKLFFHLSDTWDIGFEFLIYHRMGRYDDYPDVDLVNYENRLFVAWRF